MHQIPDGGVAQLPITKAAIKGVSISGTDMVLTLADGSQHLLRDFALKVALQPQLQLNLGGQVISGKDLMKLVGKVDLSEATARVVQTPGSSDDTPAPDTKKKAAAADADPADAKAAQSDHAEASAKPSQPPAPEGIAKAELTSAGGKDADFKNEAPPRWPHRRWCKAAPVPRPATTTPAAATAAARHHRDQGHLDQCGGSNHQPSRWQVGDHRCRRQPPLGH
ncbi:hypothetical protein [Ideonella paludis]|uniref:hypothetical protein n=1 Tax=Ideonella paludis TaxID=1233411 RepID=UPI0036300747